MGSVPSSNLVCDMDVKAVSQWWRSGFDVFQRVCDGVSNAFTLNPFGQ